MRKSLIIATCLSNSGMADAPKDCEFAVKQVFHDEFPSHDYGSWNTNIGDELAKNLIQAVRGATRIRIDRLIADLWEHPYRWDSGRKIAPWTFAKAPL